MCPDWQPTKTNAIRPNVFRGPFRIGDLGKTALGILREAPAGMTARDISRAALEQIGEDISNRQLLDKVANSLSNYLKKHKGDLVDSDGMYPQKWQVFGTTPARSNLTIKIYF